MGRLSKNQPITITYEDKAYLRSIEAAEKYGLPLSTIQAKAKRGDLDAVIYNGRLYVEEESFSAYCDNRFKAMKVPVEKAIKKMRLV